MRRWILKAFVAALFAVMACAETDTLYAGDNSRSKAEPDRADDVKFTEKEFGWKKDRKLSWDDFRGSIPRSAQETMAAATACGIGFETNTITSNNNDLKVHVYNLFYADNSWARPEDQDSLVLAHEQGHFDLCELYTRKLRERMSSVKVDVYTLKSSLSAIYKELRGEYESRQQTYEEETQHGLELAQQQKWQKQLEKELKDSENWME